eukprot:1378104-Prymnesium_polylepis.2
MGATLGPRGLNRNICSGKLRRNRTAFKGFRASMMPLTAPTPAKPMLPLCFQTSLMKRQSRHHPPMTRPRLADVRAHRSRCVAGDHVAHVPTD